MPLFTIKGIRSGGYHDIGILDEYVINFDYSLEFLSKMSGSLRYYFLVCHKSFCGSVFNFLYSNYSMLNECRKKYNINER